MTLIPTLLIIVIITSPLIIFIISISRADKNGKSISSPGNNSQPSGANKKPDTKPDTKKKGHNHDDLHLSKWKNETIKFLNESLSLSDIIITKNLEEINYCDLLESFEWRFKRLEILLRDKYKCSDCPTISKNNHVHHNYYLKDRLPWDIGYDALETLCPKCHLKRHKKEKIPIYKIVYGSKKQISTTRHICNRCNGSGYLDQYSHVENGICFLCRGNSINQSVFSKVLNETYRNLSFYNDELKRDNYRRFVMNLSSKEIIEKVPDACNYIPKYDNSNNQTYDNDLPF
jgi:hypothetical protein